MKSLDCVRCEEDAKCCEYQKGWIAGGPIKFMGVDLTPAFEHPARELPHAAIDSVRSQG